MSATELDDSFNAPVAKVAPVPTRTAILETLSWSGQREVATSRGAKLVSSAPAGETVFALWRLEGDELKEAGYSLSQYRGKWQISKWENVPEKIVVKREEAKALSRATTATINAPCPDGMSYLGYQLAGIAYAHERRAVLIGDEMGLGKTIQAIGIINCTPEAKRILIVCPASLKLNWKRELEKWLVRPRTIFVADSRLFPDLSDGIIIVNYDVLHRHEDKLRETEWDIFVADEAHYLKNPKARRTKMVFGERASAKEKKNGAADIPGIMAGKRILLTGTPIANKPIELFPLISYLDPINWGDFWRFARRYCNAHNDGFGWDFTGASNLGELQDKLRSTILVRRLKKDVLTELPAKRRQVIEFPATKETSDAIAEERRAFDVVDELEAQVELAAASDDTGAYQKAVDALAKGQAACFQGLSTLRLETARSKIPMVVEHLRDAIEESLKVVAFVHHKDLARALEEEFGNSAVKLVGDTPMQERQDAVDRFQNDPTCKLFIGSIMAAGVGITLTASSHVVMCELDWVPGNVSQAEDRCHRIGQKDSVLVQHLVLEGSLDATMARRIIAKQEVIDKALDVVSEKSAATADERHRARPSNAVDQLQADADRMTDDQHEAAVTAIKFLANRCNGARDWDGSGFNKIDTTIGKDLAARPFLSRKQRALARKIAFKYRGQMPQALADRLKLA